MKLVLTDIKFENEEEVYKQAKKGLAKYMAGNVHSTESPAIKLESAFMTDEMEQIFLARGWSRPGRGEEAGRGEVGRAEDSMPPALRSRSPRARRTPNATS